MSPQAPPSDDQLSQVTRSQTLKKALKWAVGIHVAVFLFSIFGLPHIRPKPVDLSRAVTVDLVAPTGDFSAAPNKTKTQQPFKPNAKPVEKKEVKANPDKPPSPVQSDAAKKEVKKPDEKKLEKPKKPVDKKVDAMKKAAEKKEQDKKESAKKTRDDGAGTKEEQQEFNSVLKNLLGAEDQTAESGNPIDAPYDPNAAVEGAAPTTSDTLALSEIDALKYQLAKCWNIPSGAMDAENLIVDIRITVNPDRTVKAAEIVDQGRYRSDTFFAAAAESARRAVFHPNCSPLALPPDKYDVWNTILIRFNPREMFGG